MAFPILLAVEIAVVVAKAVGLDRMIGSALESASQNIKELLGGFAMKLKKLPSDVEINDKNRESFATRIRHTVMTGGSALGNKGVYQLVARSLNEVTAKAYQFALLEKQQKAVQAQQAGQTQEPPRFRR